MDKILINLLLMLVMVCLSVNGQEEPPAFSLKQTFKKGQHLIILVEITRSRKVYFLINKKVKDSVDDRVKCSLQTQAQVIDVDAAGNWTQLAIKPYKLNYSLNGKELAFSHLNHVIIVERNAEKVAFSFKGKALKDVDEGIMRSFFTPNKSVVFECPETVKKGDVWDLKKNDLQTYFNGRQNLLSVDLENTVGKMLVKAKNDKKYTLESTSFFRRLYPRDGALKKLQADAAVGSLKMTLERPTEGSKEPFSTSTLMKIAYIGKDIKEGVNLELSITMQDQTVQLIKELDGQK